MSCKPGQEVAPDPNRFSEYFATSTNAACIDFNGVSGPLDFNNDTGEAPSDIALWCPDAAKDRFPQLSTYYSASTGALVTTLPPDSDPVFCP